MSMSFILRQLGNFGPDVPMKTDDFLPIAQSSGAFETGLLTSRPGLKGYI